MQVKESNSDIRPYERNLRAQFTDAISVFSEGVQSTSQGKFKGTIQFQKIKLQSSVFVRFGIE